MIQLLLIPEPSHWAHAATTSFCPRLPFSEPCRACSPCRACRAIRPAEPAGPAEPAALRGLRSKPNGPSSFSKTDGTFVALMNECVFSKRVWHIKHV